MKRIFSSFDRIAVFHVKNLLESEGIASTVKNEFLSSAMGELPPAECQAEVWVRDSDWDRAQETLFSNQYRTGPSWRCASCGEESGPQFTQCWKCGEFRRSAPA